MNPNQRGVPSQRSKRKLSEGKRPTWLYTVANSHGATLSFTGRPDETDLTTFLWKLEIRLKKACIADWESIKEFLVDVLGGPALEYLRINSEWWRRFLSTKKISLSRQLSSYRPYTKRLESKPLSQNSSIGRTESGPVSSASSSAIAHRYQHAQGNRTTS